MSNIFNDNILKGKWIELKGDIKKLWGKITDDELESTQGDAQSLGGIVQQKYGLKEDEFRAKMNELIARYSPNGDPTITHH
jgi:uncharacterized protein YjbJ (UPF0337 family)